MQMIVLALSLLLSATCLLYLVQLSNRLTSNHREARPQSPLSDEELSNVSYEDIDMLKSIPAQPTHQNYVLIGGSGYLGTYIAKLLLLRGETSIRVLDLHPPVPDVASNPAVTFIQTDITTMHSVREGLTTPFPGKSGRATVIFHTAALIRFWERASYTWDASHKVNVLGTSNVLSVAKKLPNAILIFTSSADTAIPGPKFLKLGFDQKTAPKDKITISDEDAPLSPDAGPESSYTRSKIAAERLVIGSNGWNGLKTGIIRPGHTIMGPNDRLLTSTLTMPRVPVFDSIWSHTNVCVWDAAAAHILYADAMQRIPEETAGQTFLVTGKGPAWRIRDTRNALKFYSTRPLVFDQIPPLFIYILAHFVEIFLYLRYYTLAPFYLLRSRELNLAPRWMGQLVLLQPATFEYWLDVVIDDSRARKILGYQPQWETAQVIRYTVDEMQSGRARKGHGLELKVD